MNHNPRNFRFLVDPVRVGTLQNVGHTTSQVRLAAGAEPDNFFNGWAFLVLTSGPAASEYRRIIGYTTLNDDAIVDPPFSAVPGGDTYAIYMILTGDPVFGTAVAGSPEAIQLQPKEGLRDDFWAGCDIDLVGGVGGNVHYPAQRRQIVNYDGAGGGIATVNRKWDTIPNGTTKYRIHGHLYTPCKALEAYADAAALLRVSDKPFGLAYGNYNLTARYGDPTSGNLFTLLEIATDAAAATVNLHRFE